MAADSERGPAPPLIAVLVVVFELATTISCGGYQGDYYRYSVEIDYNRPLANYRLLRDGETGSEYIDDVSKHFATNRTGQAVIEVNLADFNRDMKSDEVLGELNREGLRPAELCELLAFLEKYPDAHHHNPWPIVALGSVWLSTYYISPMHDVPYVGLQVSRWPERPGYGGGDAKDVLKFRALEQTWSNTFRFAAVRK